MMDFILNRESIKWEKANAFKHRVEAEVLIGYSIFALHGLGNTKVDAMASLINRIGNKQYEMMKDLEEAS
jgi:hypothetical protein